MSIVPNSKKTLIKKENYAIDAVFLHLLPTDVIKLLTFINVSKAFLHNPRGLTSSFFNNTEAAVLQGKDKFRNHT